MKKIKTMPAIICLSALILLCRIAQAEVKLPLENSTLGQFPIAVPNVSKTSSDEAQTPLQTMTEYNLNFVNQKTPATNKSITGLLKTQHFATDAAYSMKSSMLPYALAHYKLEDGTTIDFDFDYNTGQLKSVVLTNKNSTLSCAGHDTSQENNCSNTALAFDRATGNSTLTFNNQRLQATSSYLAESSTENPEENTININGTIHGSIAKPPISILNIIPTSTGWVEIDNHKPDISRIFTTTSELLIFFMNGDQLRLQRKSPSDTLPQHKFFSFKEQQDLFSTSSIRVENLANHKLKVAFKDLKFSSESTQKNISGEFTLMENSAKLEIPELGLKFEAPHISQIDNISNNEITYLVTFYKAIDVQTPMSMSITTKDQQIISIDLKRYTNNMNAGDNGELIHSCHLQQCKNTTISADGTTLTFKQTQLSLSSLPIDPMTELFGLRHITISGNVITNVR